MLQLQKFARGLEPDLAMSVEERILEKHENNFQWIWESGNALQIMVGFWLHVSLQTYLNLVIYVNIIYSGEQSEILMLNFQL